MDAEQHPVVVKLRAVLATLTPDHKQATLFYRGDTVGYPGGSYPDNQIIMKCNGRTEAFSAELTDRNPLVTATEIYSRFIRPHKR